jgi:hypothetical protein
VPRKAAFRESCQKEVRYLKIADLLGTEDAYPALFALARHQALSLEKIRQLAEKLSQRQGCCFGGCEGIGPGGVK